MAKHAECPNRSNLRPPNGRPAGHHIATPAPPPGARGIINTTAHQRSIASFIRAPLAPPREVARDDHDAIPNRRFAHL